MLEDLYLPVGGPALATPSWPPGWPARLPIGWEPAPANVAGQTGPFLLLYETVTAEIRGHAVGRLWNPDEALFFDCLIAGFYQEYLKWPSGPVTDEYLELFHRSSFRALAVVAHAYLHLAYDMPRVLADTFRALPGPVRTDVSPRYLDLQDGLKRVLDDAGSDRQIMGVIVLALGWLPGRSHFLDVFGNWILVLRSNAFLHAEILAARGAQRANDESHLLDSVYRAASQVVTDHPRNPIAWLGSLRTWHLVGVMTPLVVFAQVTRVGVVGLSWWMLVGAAIGLLVVAAAWLWVVDAWLASFADELGRAIQRAIRDPGSDTTLSQEPQPVSAQ
jgi:hypothetical protein